jgi:hypothetical protein
MMLSGGFDPETLRFTPTVSTNEITAGRYRNLSRERVSSRNPHHSLGLRLENLARKQQLDVASIFKAGFWGMLTHPLLALVKTQMMVFCEVVVQFGCIGVSLKTSRRENRWRRR